MSARPHDEGAAMKVAISASVSLFVMIIDFWLLMRDEVQYIWPRLCRSWSASIFIVARYLGLFSQIYNVYFTVRMYLGVHTSHEGCRIWFSYQALVVQFFLAIVEGLFMHRLYALFNCNGTIMMILISLAGGQIGSMGVSVHLSFPTNEHTTTCLLTRANPANAYFSTTTLTVTMVLLFMLTWRFLRLPARWTRQGVGWVVFRDSMCSLCSIAVLMLFMTFTSFEIIKTSISGNITYYWMVCVLWISLGRIIVGHTKLLRGNDEQDQGNTWRATLQLTSQIEIGESTLTEEFQQSELSRPGTHTPASSTLRSLSSTPTTNVTQLSPSSACTSDSRQGYFGDHPHLNVCRVPPRRPRIKTELALTKPSQLSPGTGSSTSDGAQKWLEDYLRSRGDGDDQRLSPLSPGTVPSAEVPTADASRGELSASTSDGDVLQAGDSNCSAADDTDTHPGSEVPRSEES